MGDNGAAAAATVLPWLPLLPLDDTDVALATADAQNLVIFGAAATGCGRRRRQVGGQIQRP